MTEQEHSSQKSAISREFSARLDRLKPEQKVRAIILLHIKAAGTPPTRRLNLFARQAESEAVRQSAALALGDIDAILQQSDGIRLASSPDAFGSIPVETTSAGIKALANSVHVKAILEDQALSLVR